MKNKKITIILEVAITIMIIILLFIVVKLISKKSNEEVQLSKLSDSEIFEIAYNEEEPKQVGFVDSEVENYRSTYKSVDALEEAMEKASIIGKSLSEETKDNSKMLKTELKKETDYYYAIYHEYIEYRGTGDVTFKDTYVYFKNSAIDLDEERINASYLKDKDKIKDILNIYSYLEIANDAGIKIRNPNIKEKSDNYEYTYYYISIGHRRLGNV